MAVNLHPRICTTFSLTLSHTHTHTHPTQTISNSHPAVASCCKCKPDKPANASSNTKQSYNGVEICMLEGELADAVADAIGRAWAALVVIEKKKKNSCFFPSLFPSPKNFTVLPLMLTTLHNIVPRSELVREALLIAGVLHHEKGRVQVTKRARASCAWSYNKYPPSPNSDELQAQLKQQPSRKQIRF